MQNSSIKPKKKAQALERMRSNDSSGFQNLMNLGMGVEPLAHLEPGVRFPKMGSIKPAWTRLQYISHQKRQVSLGGFDFSYSKEEIMKS